MTWVLLSRKLTSLILKIKNGKFEKCARIEFEIDLMTIVDAIEYISRNWSKDKSRKNLRQNMLVGCV